MTKTLSSLLAFSVVVAACTTGTTTVSSLATTSTNPATPTTAAPKTESVSTPVIVDYSPTVSDVGGLMYLLSHPDVRVIAISLPVAGEAGCDLGIKVTRGILTMLDSEDVPVACDPDFPDGANTWPEEFLAGHRNLSFGLPSSTTAMYEGTGPELIIEKVLASGRPVTIYAVGPLTNVARALTMDPDIVDNLERIVIMGGAVDVPGNTFEQNAEWNIYVDPASADTVIASGVPITLVPLDATNDVPVPDGYATTLKRAEQSDQIVYLSRLVGLFPAVTSGFYQFWDELAAAVVTGDVDVETEEVNLRVIVGGPETGRTARDAAGKTVTVATGVVSPDAFYEEFITRLAGASIEAASATPDEFAYLMAVADSLVEASAAFDLVYPLFADGVEYDAEAVAGAIDGLVTAFIASLEVVEELEPPDSLVELHFAYVEEFATLLDVRDQVFSGLVAAKSWDEAFTLIEMLGKGEACEAMAYEASNSGVTAEYPCNP